ncbi:MAG: hypothetical protein IJX82_02250 [Clostridia bacterium]|nr:hypothetical protein [Clostridia bacterium]
MSKKSTAMLKMAKAVSVLLILGTFLFLFVFCVFLPRTTVSNYDTLTKFPEFSWSSLFDGSYTAQLGAYFSDTVFMRDTLKGEYYAELKTWFGKETVIVNEEGEKEIILGNTSRPGDEPEYSDPFVDESDIWDESDEPSAPDFSQDTPSQGTSSSTPSQGTSSEESQTPPPDESSEEPGDLPPEIIQDGIVLLGTRAMEVYYGDPNLNKLPAFAAALNTFAANNPDLNVYSMVIPKAAAFYLDKSPTYKNLAGRTLNDLKNLDKLYSDKVKAINIYDILMAHKNEAIYMRTDHHWSSLGAYYAVKQFASDLGLPFQDISTYTKNVRTGYRGTMYAYSGYHDVIKNNPEDFVTYVPKATYTYETYDQNFQNPRERESFFHKVKDSAVASWYLTFIGGDSYAVKIKSDACNNGRKLLVVKDSYGNALVPYLLYSFEEIYVVDAREFRIHLDDFTKQQGITDVLFAECTYSAIGSSYIQKLEGLIK